MLPGSGRVKVVRSQRGPEPTETELMVEDRPAGQWTASRPLLRRLLTYRERLMSGQGFTMDEMIEALEVSERTFHRDMGYARTLDWDIEFCRRRRRWVRGEGELPLPLVTLREGE